MTTNKEEIIEEFFELQGKHTYAVREGKLDPNVADEIERQFLYQQLQKARTKERERVAKILLEDKNKTVQAVGKALCYYSELDQHNNKI